MTRPGARLAPRLRGLLAAGKRGGLKAALLLLHSTGLARAFAPATRGRGAIFMLHSVSPERPSRFDPNGILRVTPGFLEEAILATRAAGHDIVSLDEAVRRLAEQQPGAPFACFTLDDGYRDNLLYAYPIFKRHQAPFTIYVATDFCDGSGDLWWIVLENAIRAASRLDVSIGGERLTLDTGTPRQKSEAFAAIYWPLRKLPEREMRAIVRGIARDAGYDPAPLCGDLIMTWDEVRELAKDPLVTIGAHTRSHLALAKLTEEEAREEIAGSVARIEQELGVRCRHFAFPYGDASAAGPREFELARALGLATAVTTRKGVVGEAVRGALCALPRVSLNGDYQKARFVSVYLTGLPFRLAALAGSLLRSAVRRQAASAPAKP
ncbi:MAG: polysaccharide deacetylase family protein [Hyphomicrobiaceae bacterium]|nr:polysaccharide deacetylase family protein [Hyphomicrobiaceae bacterium]